MSWFDILKFEYGKEIKDFQDKADEIGYPAGTMIYDQIPKAVPLYGGRNTQSCEIDDAEIVAEAVELWRGLSPRQKKKMSQVEHTEAFNTYKKLITSPVVSGIKVWIAAPNQVVFVATKNGHHQKPYKVVPKNKALRVWEARIRGMQEIAASSVSLSRIMEALRFVEEAERMEDRDDEDE